MSSAPDDWGPWVEHDGLGCPVPAGTWGEAELGCGRIVLFRARCGSTRGGPYRRGKNANLTSAWIWSTLPRRYWGERVIRYRIRRPRGLQLLRELVENLPAPARVRETADVE